MLIGSAAAWHFHSDTPNTPTTIVFEARDHDPLHVLNKADAERYRYIFNAQESGDWKAADAKIAELTDPVLLGSIQAQRYLHRNYTSNFAELYAWLAAYNDQPEAYNIYKLAIAKRTKDDPRLPAIAKRGVLSGYGDDNGLGRPSSDPIIAEAAFHLYTGNPQAAYASAIKSDQPGAHWIAGIAAWQLKDRATAAREFAAMLESGNSISAWAESAGAFWAYRAYHSIGHKAKAAKYLELAATHPRTFYGIMARKVLQQPLEVNTQTPPALSDAALHNLYTYNNVRRAIALKQVKQHDRAEMELRALFPQLDRTGRAYLLSLAGELNLPSLQMSMATALKRQGLTYDVALYPTPQWQPTGGFVMDPALMFAMTRQESGFRADAKSYAGAQGLMQIMPQTATSMLQRTALELEGGLMEPASNLALGQTYLTYLIQDTAASNNLIFLTAAYNAGPGKLAEWTKTIEYSGDPLLFMELIPFAQTRHYVSQVLTSYWIYRELDGKVATSAHSLAQGKWPLYDTSALTATAAEPKASPSS